MSIKNVLLAHTGNTAFLSSLRYAVKIAKRHDAWLTGLYGGTWSYVDQVLAVGGDLRAKLKEVERSRVAELRAQFEEEAAAGGIVERSEFLPPDSVSKFAPTEIARNFDFIVTGYQPKLRNDEYRAVSPDIIALRSGRPVLVVPDGYEAETLASHALVAWDGKRSAARAINDAMTVLEEKPRKVSIVTVGNVLHELPDATWITRHLERHGVKAEHIHRTKAGGSIADVVQTTADEIGAKLIVMGAYEHSKFSQDMFGGVTHQVLRTAKVPVFMSH
ncbi:universal stress protein [Celeribacter indicus]|uniref:Putative universal stress protein UspA-like protein n=1 Tax=Celeribacter indicus TaxID=1208324 RepID=A0A0B5E5U9_9RHOB|nr:universal stress protein [Celeribacter indicus]AJE47702.1 putative universal stress protein UspA-like protein [Celeribacter indicus]SDW14684.1 Universal stress protein family protein [Celeribacter indicus]